MGPISERSEWVRRHPSFLYVAPFVSFFIVLYAATEFKFNPSWEGPLRVVLLGVVCWFCWPRELSFRPRFSARSTAVGIAVFLLWIAPEVIYPAYRSLPLFNNSLLGHVHSSLSPDAVANGWILFWRSARAIAIVPVLEELFWRAWLMRWLISPNFESVPLGSYARSSFWLVAVLFAVEHGPYWDVGLVAGIIYNWWMIRTTSVADCVWMHAVTNACLSVYVISTGHWQYWQ
jgi:uncharacterized protein